MSVHVDGGVMVVSVCVCGGEGCLCVKAHIEYLFLQFICQRVKLCRVECTHSIRHLCLHKEVGRVMQGEVKLATCKDNKCKIL